jgi:hypothetical protein
MRVRILLHRVFAYTTCLPRALGRPIGTCSINDNFVSDTCTKVIRPFEKQTVNMNVLSVPNWMMGYLRARTGVAQTYRSSGDTAAILLVRKEAVSHEDAISCVLSWFKVATGEAFKREKLSLFGSQSSSGGASTTQERSPIKTTVMNVAGRKWRNLHLFNSCVMGCDEVTEKEVVGSIDSSRTQDR